MENCMERHEAHDYVELGYFGASNNRIVFGFYCTKCHDIHISEFDCKNKSFDNYHVNGN